MAHAHGGRGSVETTRRHVGIRLTTDAKGPAIINDVIKLPTIVAHGSPMGLSAEWDTTVRASARLTAGGAAGGSGRRRPTSVMVAGRSASDRIAWGGCNRWLVIGDAVVEWRRCSDIGRLLPGRSIRRTADDNSSTALDPEVLGWPIILCWPQSSPRRAPEYLLQQALCLMSLPVSRRPRKDIATVVVIDLLAAADVTTLASVPCLMTVAFSTLPSWAWIV
jgi:hypothetical protein